MRINLGAKQSHQLLPAHLMFVPVTQNLGRRSMVTTHHITSSHINPLVHRLYCLQTLSVTACIHKYGISSKLFTLRVPKRYLNFVVLLRRTPHQFISTKKNGAKASRVSRCKKKGSVYKKKEFCREWRSAKNQKLKVKNLQKCSFVWCQENLVV